ncbi:MULTISPECIES: restriction endonuclease [Spirulina sp. CCY15215]|uniref:restriction endonuclease n=1 Tax=Spirulina sp. CCY15215 TaxID=2767591 RepID=UPI0019523813|nr:restriction endonuclease [Spirulina major]
MTSQSKIPTFDRLFEPTIKALHELGGSGTVQEIYDKVCDLKKFSEEQQAILHKNGSHSEISYRMGWTRTCLKKYGAIENIGRGVWALTSKGKALRNIDANEIKNFVKTQDNSNSSASPSPERTDAIANDNDSEVWIDKLLSILQQIPPDAFERLCQRVLRESGFIKVEVTGKQGDGSIDGIGVLKISLLSFQVFFQCKRYSGAVGAKEIRDFRGAMVGRTDKGLFLTTGTFNRAAKQEATRDGAPALDLIDGEQLCYLLRDLGIGVATKTIEVVEVKIDEAWFEAL